MFHHLPKRCVALIASALALLTVALPAAVSARAWPANDEASIFSRRYRGQDETGDSSGGGGGGGGSSHGGGSSESGGGSSSGGSHGESGGSSGDSGGDHGGSSSGGEDKVEKPKTKSAGGDSDKDDRF